jgi:hypothetical protein
MTEDELDAIRRRREEATAAVLRHVDEIPFDELLLQQIRAPWARNLQIATMLSCARLNHPTIGADDPPDARCVCNWRRGT